MSLKNKEYPYVICHMLQSIDGRIAGKLFQESVTQSLSQIYKKMSLEYNADALVYGSVTASEIFRCNQHIDLSPFSNQNIDKEDYVVMNNKKKWLVVIDPQGELCGIYKHYLMKD